MLKIDVDEPDLGGLEDADFGLGGGRLAVDAEADQAAVDRAARQLRVDAALHDLCEVVERQPEPPAQLADQLLFDRRQADLQVVRRVRAIFDRRALLPAADGALADAELGGELGDRRLARLDVGPRLRRRRGVGVQLQVHARSSLISSMPRLTPSPSRQSAGTQHLRAG
jgi:hypothetical protein